MPEAQSRKSRIPRWGLWVAVTVFTVVALVGVRWGWPIYRQSVIVAKFQRRQIRVTTPKWKPDWLRRAVGGLWLGPFIGLDIQADSVFTDRDLALCPSLSYVKSLDLLRNQKVTSTGLSRLAELPYLRSLNLSRTKVADSDLENLRELLSLRELFLAETSITDRGLANIASLRNLTAMDLTRTEITDAGLRSLYGLTHLEVLTLYKTQITSDGIERLRTALPHLRVHGP